MHAAIVTSQTAELACQIYPQQLTSSANQTSLIAYVCLKNHTAYVQFRIEVGTRRMPGRNHCRDDGDKGRL